MQPDAVPFSRPTTPSPHPPKIGWYGLGAMGYFMARNIATSRQSQSNTTPVLLYNRTLSKAQKLVDQVGLSVAKVASSPAQLATECDIIFTNLSDDASVQSVYNEFAKALSVCLASLQLSAVSHSPLGNTTVQSKDLRRYHHGESIQYLHLQPPDP